GRVDFTVAHIRAETTVLHHYWFIRRRIFAQFTQRGGTAGATTALRLLIQLKGLFESDRENLLFISQRPRISALLQIRAIAAVLRSNVVPGLWVSAHYSRLREQTQSLVEGDRLQLHGLKQ